MNQSTPVNHFSTNVRSDQNAQSRNEIDLIGVLKRRKGFIALGIFLAVIAAALYYFLTPPTYRAQMEILVGQRSGNVAHGASRSDGDVEGTRAEDDVLSTQIQLFTSRRILKTAIDQARLGELTSFREAKAKGKPLIDHLSDNLTVTKGGDGVARDAHTLKAQFNDPSPTDCAVVLRAVFDAYAAYLKEHFEGTSTDAVNSLTKQAEQNARAVLESEEQLAAFLSSTDLMWDGEKTQNVHKDRLKTIETTLSELEESKAESTARLAVIQDYLKRNDGQDFSDLDRLALLSEKEVGRLKIMFDVTKGDVASEAFQAEQPIRQESARAEYSKYLDLVLREKKLLDKFSEGHPSVVSIREQLSMLREFIDANSAKDDGKDPVARLAPTDMLNMYVGLLRHDISEADIKRNELLKRSEVELAAAKVLETAEMKVASLKNELNRRQGLYEVTKAAVNELDFVRDYAGYATDVIGDAEPQKKPVWPRPAILAALALVAGSVLGFLMAAAADFADSTFNDPDDVSRTLGAPIIAHVPQFPVIQESKRRGILAMDPTVYAFHKPQSSEAEVFRVLRTSILCSIKDSNIRVLQVTSPQPGDGKSTDAVNLAVSLAQAGKRVLLMDADLRRPRVADLLRIKNCAGLADVLKGDVELLDAIHETPQRDLMAMPSGRRPANPAELLQSPAFSSLVKSVSEKFDFVIIDTPPVLAVSDAAVVAETADGLILVLRIDKHSRQAGSRTRQVLDEHNVPILGIVINGTGFGSSGSYGYKYGGDLSYYGYSPADKYGSYYRDAVVEEDAPVTPRS